MIKISTSNTKLGNIPSFSLPSLVSCPGATETCFNACYAAKLERIYKNVEKAYTHNLEQIESTTFVAEFKSELNALLSKKNAPKVFRWHVSGDIPDIDYLHNMKNIMIDFPDTTFYAYTRNWALPEWEEHLKDIRTLSNFTLIASIDDSHIAAGVLPDNTYRVAYFGSHTIQQVSTLLNKNVVMCPNQITDTLCDKCKFCFNPKLNNTTRSVYFKKH